jgi:hypothetical protein
MIRPDFYYDFTNLFQPDFILTRYGPAQIMTDTSKFIELIESKFIDPSQNFHSRIDVSNHLAYPAWDAGDGEGGAARPRLSHLYPQAWLAPFVPSPCIVTA